MQNGRKVCGLAMAKKKEHVDLPIEKILEGQNNEETKPYSYRLKMERDETQGK